MIAFYIDCSDRSAGSVLREHLWSDAGIESRGTEEFDWKRYGTELREILIGIYAEGEIPVDAPTEPRVGRVSRKDKSLRIDVAVDPKALTSMDQPTARAYLVALIASALRAPLARRKWDFDFEQLAADFERTQAATRQQS